MEKLLSRLSLMAAVIFGFAITAVPLDVYVVNRRQVGIVRLTGFAFARAVAIGSFVLAFFDAFRAAFKQVLRSPRFVPALAAVALVLMIAGVAPAEGAVVLAGITAEEAREQINKLGTDMQALIKAAAGEQRDMTPEEETKFDKMDADREKLIATERRLLRAAELDNPTGRRSTATLPNQETRTNGRDEKRILSVQDGVRAWLLSHRGVDIPQEFRDAAKALGFPLGAKQITLRLGRDPLQSTRFDVKQEWEKRNLAIAQREFEKRALSAGSTASPVDGAYTVQDELMRPLEESLLAFGGMRRLSTVIRTETGANLPVPTDNDTSNKGEIIDENTQVNEKDVAFGQIVFNAYKYSSKMVRVSVELLQDASFPIGPYLGRKLGTRIGRIQNDHFTTGDGSGKPNGIVTAAGNSNVQLAAQTPTYAEMVSIQHSVDPAYRESDAAGWMFHDTMLAEIKKIVDASTGRPIWLPTMAGGEPDTILGDPYIVNQSMAVAAGSGAAKSIIYGALDKYLIRDVRDITLVVADQLYAHYHQVAFLAFARADGDLLDAGTDPVKYALNKA